MQATPGKKVVGVRVTDERGARIGFGRATGRYFAKILSSLILCIGYIMVAFTRRRQGLHDLMAGTLVVLSDASEQELRAAPAARPMGAGAIVLVVIAAGFIPITGILAAIAIPAYQDYTIRAQIAEGLHCDGALPRRRRPATGGGPRTDADRRGRHRRGAPRGAQLREERGRRELDRRRDLRQPGEPATSPARKLVFVPALADDERISWVCGHAEPPESFEAVLPRYSQFTDIENKYLPRVCRE